MTLAAFPRPASRPAVAHLVSLALFVGSAACGGSPTEPTPSPSRDPFGQVDHTGGPADAGPDTTPPPTPPNEETGPGDDAAPTDAPGAVADAEPPKPPEPPPFPKYKGTCPKLTWGSTADTSVNLAFPSGGEKRRFRLVVPKSYDPTRAYPLVFAWHWLNASSASFVRDGELESATEQMGFIAALPDQLEDDKGTKVYKLDWPFAEFWGQDKELQFFDDMLACIDEQLHVDHRHVHGVGVSAGGLWVTFLSTTDRVKWLASVESLSGGLGQEPFVWKMDYKPQPNKFPALVLWGGASDWMILSFDDASKRYRDSLIGDGHFVETCTHDSGHAMPPVPEPTDGSTKFKFLWQFFLDHPYGLPAGTSPYQTKGLPGATPSWCKLASPLPAAPSK